MKDAPIRMCAVCRKHGEQDNFIRVVRSQGKVLVTGLRKISGRSLYLCKDQACIDKAIKSRLITRTFPEADDSIYEEIKAAYANSQN